MIYMKEQLVIRMKKNQIFFILYFKLNCIDKNSYLTAIEINNADDLLLKVILVMLCKFF
jgi:hypothetical protein